MNTAQFYTTTVAAAAAAGAAVAIAQADARLPLRPRGRCTEAAFRTFQSLTRHGKLVSRWTIVREAGQLVVLVGVCMSMMMCDGGVFHLVRVWWRLMVVVWLIQTISPGVLVEAVQRHDESPTLRRQGLLFDLIDPNCNVAKR